MSDQHAPIGEDDLQAFVDDRLAGERRAMIEAYLAAHPEVRDRVATERRQREALRAQLADKFAEPIPARLRIASIRASRRARWVGRLRAAAAAVVIFVIGGAGGWLAREMQSPPPASTVSVAQDAAMAYRTFVVEVAHPVEVDASHEAHLLHWLSKRLGRPLAAPDLSRFGYRLMGGRLLPSGSGAAAQLMYDDASGKRLTVYVQAGRGSQTAFRFRQLGNASTFAWIDQGFGFAVTAQVGRAGLLPIAEAVYRGFDGSSRSDGAR